MARRALDEVGQRVPIQTRTSEALRDRLAEAATKAGRSMAQEVELRLERSFDLTEIIEILIDNSISKAFDEFKDLLKEQEALMLSHCGGDDLFLLWRLPAFVISQVELERGKLIREDEETRRAAERAVLGAITDVFRNLPPSYYEWKNGNQGSPQSNEKSSSNIARRRLRLEDVDRIKKYNSEIVKRYGR